MEGRGQYKEENEPAKYTGERCNIPEPSLLSCTCICQRVYMRGVYVCVFVCVCIYVRQVYAHFSVFKFQSLSWTVSYVTFNTYV